MPEIGRDLALMSLYGITPEMTLSDAIARVFACEEHRCYGCQFRGEQICLYDETYQCGDLQGPLATVLAARERAWPPPPSAIMTDEEAARRLQQMWDDEQLNNYEYALICRAAGRLGYRILE